MKGFKVHGGALTLHQQWGLFVIRLSSAGVCIVKVHSVGSDDDDLLLRVFTVSLASKMTHYKY